MSLCFNPSKPGWPGGQLSRPVPGLLELKLGATTTAAVAVVATVAVAATGTVAVAAGTVAAAGTIAVAAGTIAVAAGTFGAAGTVAVAAGTFSAAAIASFIAIIGGCLCQADTAHQETKTDS